MLYYFGKNRMEKLTNDCRTCRFDNKKFFLKEISKIMEKQNVDENEAFTIWIKNKQEMEDNCEN